MIIFMWRKLFWKIIAVFVLNCSEKLQVIREIAELVDMDENVRTAPPSTEADNIMKNAEILTALLCVIAAGDWNATSKHVSWVLIRLGNDQPKKKNHFFFQSPSYETTYSRGIAIKIVHCCSK